MFSSHLWKWDPITSNWKQTENRLFLPPAILSCAHNELADVLQTAEHQVRDFFLVLVPVQIGGVDVCDAGASDQRDALVTWTFSHKQHGRLPFVGPRPKKTIKKSSLNHRLSLNYIVQSLQLAVSWHEGEGVLLCVDDVSVFASLSGLLFHVELGVLGVLWACRVSVVPTTQQVQNSCSITRSLQGSRSQHSVNSNIYHF